MMNIFRKKATETAAVPFPDSTITSTTASSSLINSYVNGTATATVTAPSFTGTTTATYPAYGVAGGGYAVGTGYAGLAGQVLTTTGVAGGPVWTTAGALTGAFAQPQNPNIATYNTPAGKEIVKITKDGEVVWGPDMDITAAAEAFGRAVVMGTEMKAGITERVKCNIRDKLFGEIISIAKEKGSLTADELTLILEASKIMEKLKGI